MGSPANFKKLLEVEEFLKILEKGKVLCEVSDLALITSVSNQLFGDNMMLTI